MMADRAVPYRYDFTDSTNVLASLEDICGIAIQLSLFLNGKHQLIILT